MDVILYRAEVIKGKESAAEERRAFLHADKVEGERKLSAEIFFDNLYGQIDKEQLNHCSQIYKKGETTCSTHRI